MNRRRCRTLPVAVLVVLTVGMMLNSDTTVAAQVTFYVATGGDDAWSGTRKTPNKGKSDGPFATLTRARRCSTVEESESTPDSPAWDIGFEKLALERIGLYGREDSTSDRAEALKGEESKDDAK